jgi:hypothetical protein
MELYFVVFKQFYGQNRKKMFYALFLSALLYGSHAVGFVFHSALLLSKREAGMDGCRLLFADYSNVICFTFSASKRLMTSTSNFTVFS